MIRTLLLRGAAAAALAGACMQAGMAADAPMPMPPPDGMHHMERNHEEAMKAGLAHMADRLEIKASQEGAWQKFSAAFVDMMKTVSSEPMAASPEADAASIVRARAQAAATRAQAVSRLADATTELQQVLNADQRHVLNEMARHFERMRMDSMGPARGTACTACTRTRRTRAKATAPGTCTTACTTGTDTTGRSTTATGRTPTTPNPRCTERPPGAAARDQAASAMVTRLRPSCFDR